MRLKIVDSTGGIYKGFEFDASEQIILPNGNSIDIERTIDIELGLYRLVTSNFIIDCKEA